MPKKKKHAITGTSTVDIGNKLEHQVCVCYEALGFKIAKKVNLRGHDLDLIATRYVPGARELVVAIEVKYRDSLVGINDVTPFIVWVQHLANDRAINNAVMVTNNGFTEEARLAVNGNPLLRLMNLQELEHDLLNNSEALLRVIQDYEISSVSREYYRLHADRQDGDRIEDLTAYALQWGRGLDKLLMILGDFGSGKTTIMERIHYEAAQARIADAQERFPILLRLRTLRQYPDLWQFVESSLRNLNYIAPSRSIFERELSNRRLLLLLDGFDEIHTGASPVEMGRYLHRLSPLLASGSPCIVSARPTYFESLDAMTEAFRRALGVQLPLERVPQGVIDFGQLIASIGVRDRPDISRSDLTNIVSIQKLDRSQIHSVLEKHTEEIREATGKSVAQVERSLYATYDIEDLMRRPLLLNMILVAILTARKDITDSSQPFGPSSLYEVYTQASAVRDREKNQDNQFLTPDERLAGCRLVALHMMNLGRLELTLAEVEAAVADLDLRDICMRNRVPVDEARARTLTDIRICSFLRFGDDGSLRFAHTSFAEFFVAQHLVILALKLANLKQFAAMPLSREIIYFLGSFARDDVTFLAVLRKLLQGTITVSPKERNLLNRVAFASGSALSGGHLAGGEVRDVDLRRATISDAVFVALSLVRVNLRDVAAKQCKFEEITMSSVTVEASKWDRCVLALRSERCEVAASEFISCTVHVTGHDWYFKDVHASRSSLFLAGGGGLMDVSLAKHSQLVLMADLQLHWSQIDVEDSDVLGHRYDRWYEGDMIFSFQRCVLAGVWFDVADILLSTNSRGRPTLGQCTGVVLVELGDEGWTKGQGTISRLKELYPAIEFIPALEFRNELKQTRLLSSKGKSPAEECKAIQDYLYPPLDATLSLGHLASQANPLVNFVRHIQKLNLVNEFVDGPVWSALRSAAFANAEVRESQKPSQPKKPT